MAGYQWKQKQKPPKNAGLEKLQKEIADKTFRKVYLFYGEERYLTLQYRDRLIAAAVSPEDTLNLNIHKESAPDISKVMDECLAVPFFAERRVVVLQDTGLFSPAKARSSQGAEPDTDASAPRETSSRKTRSGKNKTASSPQDMLTYLIGQLPDTTILLFVENGADKRSRLYKAVANAGMAMEFEHPDGDMLKLWVQSRMKNAGIRITNEALTRLLDWAGTDMSMLSSQIDKLVACAGQGGAVTLKEVTGLVTQRLETRIFDLVDAVGHRQRREAVTRYDELIRMKEEPNRILYYLGKQFNQLYQTKALLAKRKPADEMMKALGINYSFQLSKLREQSAQFTEEQLRSAVEDCVALEQKYKTGGINVRLAIEMLLVRYSR